MQTQAQQAPPSENPSSNGHIIIFPLNQDGRFDRTNYSTYIANGGSAPADIEQHLERADRISRRKAKAATCLYLCYIISSAALLGIAFAFAFAFSIDALARGGIFIGWFVLIMLLYCLIFASIRSRSRMMRRELVRLHTESYPDQGYRWNYVATGPHRIELHSNYRPTGDVENPERQ